MSSKYQKQDNNYQNKSTVEKYLPRYRRVKQQAIPSEIVQQSPQKYLDIQQKIRQSLDKIEMVFNKRMAVHEQELLLFYRQQIEWILKDVRKLVDMLKMTIQQKSISKQLWDTRNELDYFKHQCLKLFEQNIKLRSQIKALKLEQNLLNYDLSARDSVLRDLSYKLEKQKKLKYKYKRQMSEDQLKVLKKYTKIRTQQKKIDNKSIRDSLLASCLNSNIKQINEDINIQQKISEKHKLKFPILFQKQRQNIYKLKAVGKKRRNTQFHDISTNQKSVRQQKSVNISDPDFKQELGKNFQKPVSNTYEIIRQYEDKHINGESKHIRGQISQKILSRKPKIKNSPQIIKYKLSLPKNL